MKHNTTTQKLILAASCALAMSPLSGARAATDNGNTQATAQGILQTWNVFDVPEKVTLKPVVLDSAHAALVIHDVNSSCNTTERPSCVVSLPHIQKLLTDARAHHMLVVYIFSPPTPKEPAAAPAAIAQIAGEPTVLQGGPDKWGPAFKKVLTDHGITTVVPVGTTSAGSILYTASEAANEGLNVVVPIDCESSHTIFTEFYPIWHLQHGAGQLSRLISLSSSDQITIR